MPGKLQDHAASANIRSAAKSGPVANGSKTKENVGWRPTGRWKPRLESCVASAQTSPRQASSCVSIPHHTTTQHRVKAFLGRLAQRDPPIQHLCHEGRSPAAARQSQVLWAKVATNEKEAMEDCGVGEGFQADSLRRSSPLPKPPHLHCPSSLAALPAKRDSRATLKGMRGACSAGAERKKRQTRPLVERSGIHHTYEPGSPSACGLVIDYM